MSSGFPNFFPDYSVIFTNYGTTSINSLYQKDDPTTGIAINNGMIDINILGTNKLSIDGVFRLNTSLVSNYSASFASITTNAFTSAPTYAATGAAPVIFNNFAAPQITGSFIPTASYNVYIGGPPNSGQVKYSLYVSSGTSYLGQIAECPRFNVAAISGYSASISYSGNSAQTVSIPESSNSAISFLVSSAKTGQTINAGNCQGSTINGAILRSGSETITNLTPSNTIHLNYFSPPGFTTDPSTASTVCISSAPTASTTYALLVQSGKSSFCGGVNSDSYLFCADQTSGIQYSSPGTFNLVSQSTAMAQVSSSAFTVNNSLNFSTSTCSIKLQSSPILNIGSSGLFTIASGYAGTITGSVTIRGAYGTAFATATVSANLFCFPVGARTYQVLITTGTSTVLKAGAALGSGNYTNGIIITFSDFTSITSAYLDGNAATGQASSAAMTTASTDKNIILDMSSAGIVPTGNTVTVMATQTATVITGNKWSTGTTLSLSLFGYIVADR